MMHHILILLGLLMVAYTTGYEAENAFSRYWEEHISLPHPPSWLVAKASPLDFHQTTMFMKLMEQNELTSHLHSFCEQANIACPTNATKAKIMDSTTLLSTAKWNIAKLKYDSPNETPIPIVSQEGLPFFRETTVKEGRFMFFLDLRDPVPNRSFLPRSLASKISFSSTKIKELKKVFAVADESNMDDYIQDAIKTCEKSPIRREERTCATSAEDLIDFVVKKFGHNVRLWTTESVEGLYENVTIGVVKLIYENLFESPMICHSQPFPFQVYYCHVLHKVKIYSVDVHVEKRVKHAIMSCHYDTSAWNPNHLAFKVLGFGLGLIEVCHWINENGIVWAKAQD